MTLKYKFEMLVNPMAFTVLVGTLVAIGSLKLEALLQDLLGISWRWPVKFLRDLQSFAESQALDDGFRLIR